MAKFGIFLPASDGVGEFKIFETRARDADDALNIMAAVKSGYDTFARMVVADPWRDLHAAFAIPLSR